MSEPLPKPTPDDELEASAQRLRAAAALFGAARLSTTAGLDPGADPLAGFEPAPAPSRNGERIGPYRLERVLGRGGMGAVYAAIRVDGEFEQTVALKLLRSDCVAPEALARFQRERAILARLQHPHIARLLDGGVTVQGEVWFALELVAGKAIVDYADECGLDLQRRLALFLETCEAVGYAHRNLVVHRDLKPSNILVDADGHAKLLDFGIAKLLEAEAEAGRPAEPLTLADQRVLTPDYAAPEQVLGEAITTATDIYALGLLLFELLTGRRAQNLHDLSWAEAMERVATTDPVPPSRNATAPDSPPRIAAATLRGDLDAIVLKALRREPERRYATVAEFADDVRRYVAGYPVRARGGARGYRFGRFLRRHRIGVAAATAVVLALATGLAGALWQARAARLEAERANEVRNFVLGLFRATEPEQAHGREISARELLDAGAARVRQELSRQPQVQIELLSTLGNLYLRLGQIQSALPLLEQALALSRSSHSAGDPALAMPLVDLAAARLGEPRYAETATLLDEADRLLARAGDEADSLRSRVLAVRVPLAIRTDDLDSAERYARQRLALEERRDKRDQAEYGRALGALGWTLMWQDQWPEAERLARAQLETDSLNQVGPMEVGGKDLTLIVNILMLRGRYREALEYEEQNYDSARRRVGEQHVATASIRIIRALLWDRTGRLAEGEAEMREAVAQLAGAHRSIADNSFDPWNLGRLLLDRGKLSEAQPLLRRSYDTVRARFGNAAKATLFVERDLGAALVALGDSNAAEAVLAHTAETFRARPGERGIQLAETQVRLSELRHLQQRDEEAQTLARAALATLLDTLGAEHDETGRAHHALGMALLARGETAAAMTELKAALDNYEHLFGPEDARVMRYRFDWGTALAAARPAEAEPILRQAAEALARDSQDETATRTAAQAWLKAHPSRPTRALSSIGTDVVVTGAEGSASR